LERSSMGDTGGDGGLKPRPCWQKKMVSIHAKKAQEGENFRHKKSTSRERPRAKESDQISVRGGK